MTTPFQGVSPFYATGEMNVKLSSAILETNKGDLAASLTDEDTEFILQNSNFQELAQQWRKELNVDSNRSTSEEETGKGFNDKLSPE